MRERESTMTTVRQYDGDNAFVRLRKRARHNGADVLELWPFPSPNNYSKRNLPMCIAYLCYALLCSALLCSALLYSTLLYSTLLYSTLLYSTYSIVDICLV
ncbi:hypothetical protein DPMN_167620 [Dreissena polymorpha]|uniref:Uncharacterized protein n=1 Tax=Dreissena polymorpha TaxID=45954 RepID=A0A9D4IWI4_DREPO|nr:hypothetical protein DPMN_167620 [Dreissena polymorpha]